MQVYLVGGCVRDSLLDLPIKDRDWVVVGATPQHMLSQGYVAVGKDFPVFLHPRTKEEYALARTERKVAQGYTGFVCFADPCVTLTQDLQRRDLTINAMAKTADGQILDPYNGQQDLQQQLLRHVSPAFQEDPVRILRLARFAAKLAGFTVHPSTLQLVHAMVQQGETKALVAERVWQELQRALETDHPWRFFEVLLDCRAHVLQPLVLDEVPIDLLKKATLETHSTPLRFAVLLSGLTPANVTVFCQHLRAPKPYQVLASMVVNHSERAINPTGKPYDAEMWLQLLLDLDVLRRPERFEQFLGACQILADNHSQGLTRLTLAAQHLKNVTHHHLQQQGLQGLAFADALHQLRLQAMQAFLNTQP